jgi:DNA repair protein RadC
MQTTLELNVSETPAARVKTYRVPKYRTIFVKENNALPKITLTNRGDVSQFCRSYFADLPIEHIAIIALNSSSYIQGYMSAEGCAGQCVCYPQNVFRFLLGTCATGFILAHNHPAESTFPSKADWLVTDRLYQAGKILEIHLLDHIIVCGETLVSMRDTDNWDTMSQSISH